MDPTKIKRSSGLAMTQQCQRRHSRLLRIHWVLPILASPNYSKIARPLIDLTRKATPFHWEPPQVKAFETLKTIMCRKPILRQPNYDDPAPFPPNRRIGVRREEPYSYRREKPIRTPKNHFCIPSPTIHPPSFRWNGITTSTKESS